jgi:hypothetical protein
LGEHAGTCASSGFEYYILDENKVHGMMLCERCNQKTVKKNYRYDKSIGLWCKVCDEYPIINGKEVYNLEMLMANMLLNK